MSKKTIKPTILWICLINMASDALSKKSMLTSVDFILSEEMNTLHGIKDTIKNAIQIGMHCDS